MKFSYTKFKDYMLMTYLIPENNHIRLYKRLDGKLVNQDKNGRFFIDKISVSHNWCE